MNRTRLLLNVCRWMFRILLIALAAPLLLTAVALLRRGADPLTAFYLLLFALLLPGAELVFRAFNQLEKKIR